MTTANLDIQTLTMLGAFIPLIVGLITKKWAQPGVKAVANLFLAAITAGIAVAVQAQGHVNVESWLVNMASTFVLSIVSYYGLWKPTTIATVVQSATAGFGVGSAATPATTTNGLLSYDEIKALNQSNHMQREAPITAEQARKAAERDAAIDELGNKLLNGGGAGRAEANTGRGGEVKAPLPSMGMEAAPLSEDVAADAAQPVAAVPKATPVFEASAVRPEPFEDPKAPDATSVPPVDAVLEAVGKPMKPIRKPAKAAKTTKTAAKATKKAAQKKR